MISTKRQKKYIDKLKEKAVAQLEKIGDPSLPEYLHSFRVSVKKLKALGAFIAPAKNKKYLHPIKKSFKDAGNIRNLSNLTLLEEKHHLLPPFDREKRKQELEDAYKKFSLHKNKYRADIKKTGKLLRKKIKPVKDQVVKEYFKNELNKVSFCLQIGSPHGIHNCRKQLKNIIYLHDFLPGSLQKELNIRTKYLEKIQDNIGKWHDLLLAETALTKRPTGPGQIQPLLTEKEAMMTTIKTLCENFPHKIKKS